MSTTRTPPTEPAPDTPRPITVEFRIAVTALVHPEPSGGYWAEVPTLPGCVTEGETLDEVRANLREAAEGWLLARQDLGAMRRAAGSPKR